MTAVECSEDCPADVPFSVTGGSVGPSIPLAGGFSYEVTESPPLGWRAVTVEVEPAAVGCSTELPGQTSGASSFSFELDFGEDVVLCWYNQEVPAIVVSKSVSVAPGGSGPPAGALFEITVSCPSELQETFELLAGGSHVVSQQPSQGEVCKVTETVSHGADSVSGVGPVTIDGLTTVTVVNSYAGAPPPPPADATVTITKQVVVEEGAAPPAAETAFGLALDCVGQEFAPFTLSDGQSASFTVPANTACSLTETDRRGADLVSGEFAGTLITGTSAFTVTNTYEAPGARLTIAKLTAGGGAAGEQFAFRGDWRADPFFLADGEEIDFVLAPGAYTVSELAGAGFAWTPSASCSGGALGASSASGAKASVTLASSLITVFSTLSEAGSTTPPGS